MGAPYDIDDTIRQFPVKSAPGQIVPSQIGPSQIGPKSKRPQNESQIGHIHIYMYFKLNNKLCINMNSYYLLKDSCIILFFLMKLIND